MAQTSKRRGITMMESLAATLVVVLATTGGMSVFFASLHMTHRANQAAVASAIARRRIEEVRNVGFANAAEGTTTMYYDAKGEGGSPAATADDVYLVTTTITSDALISGAPTKTSLRNVIVTVKRRSDNVVLEVTGTHLSWGGI